MKFVSSSHLDGDYLEFGVYEGFSFASAFHFAQRQGLEEMKFFAFDSFQGLPKITGLDAQGGHNFRQGQYSCSVDRFRKSLVAKGVDLNEVTIVPGWYQDVLNHQTKRNLTLSSAAVIYIDCDLYASTVSVLNFASDYIQDGTVIIFDDWCSFKGNPNRGEQRAFTEWLSQHKSIQAVPYSRFGHHGNSFILSLT